MKKYLIAAIVFLAIYLLLQLLPTAENSNNPSEKNGYLPSMMEVKDEAEKNIDDAVQKENERLQETVQGAETNKNNQTTMNNKEFAQKYSKALLKTSLGNIEVEFFGNESPETVGNFLKLSSEGFYNGTAFHRVIKDFMIQGGDPLSKEADWSRVGTGGPGYKFADEFNSKKLVRGSLAMANSGPNTNGSQFFIVTTAETPWLDGKHTNFGQVVSGMEVVDKIENSPVNGMDQPLQKITINSIELLEK